MTETQIYETISRTVRLCVQDAPPMEEVIPQLVRSLDELSLAYHYSKGAFAQTEYPDPPENEYQQLRAIIEKHFPQLVTCNVDIASALSYS